VAVAPEVAFPTVYAAHRRALGRLTVAGGLLLLLVAACALLAPFIASWRPTTIDFNASLGGPGSPHHVLGTDHNGMDILSRLLFAARLDLGIAVAAVAIAASLGSTLGAIVGYAGGWLDEVAMRVMDVFQSFPAFVLALAVATMLGTSTIDLIAVIAVVNAPSYVRLMRAEVRSVREEGWVEAARCAGLGWTHILFRQVIPNSLRPVFVIAPLNCGWAILTLAGLSFVGLGVKLPTPEWGAMIALGADDMVSGQWWTSVLPGLFLFVSVLGFNLLGEGLQSRRG
jgi:peptide/nickel transport system permease protein